MFGGRRTQRLVFATALAIILATTPAWAYVDPGSGSLFLQATLAGLLAITFAIKTYWRNLTTWIGARLHVQPRNVD
jgi:hypothetical protein